MSQRKKTLNTYTLTLKVLPFSGVWYESSEQLSLMDKFTAWIDRFQSPLLELTNCNLLLDSKYLEPKKKEVSNHLKAKEFIGAVITFKALNEDFVCELMEELPSSNKYSWNFEILKSSELFSKRYNQKSLI
jgi:hypothetical protein